MEETTIEQDLKAVEEPKKKRRIIALDFTERLGLLESLKDYAIEKAIYRSQRLKTPSVKKVIMGLLEETFGK